MESEDEWDLLQAAFNKVVKKRSDFVQIPYVSFLPFLLGLSELEDTEKFLDSGECEIDVRVVGPDGNVRQREWLEQGTNQKSFLHARNL